jgi:hypothetical protein
MKGCAYTVETDIAANSTGKVLTPRSFACPSGRGHSPGLRPEHLDGMTVSVREARKWLQTKPKSAARKRLRTQ